MKKRKFNPKYADTKCFVFASDGYEEITYSELYQRSETDTEYASRKFIPLHGMLMEVTPEQYVSFYRVTRRFKYLKEQDVKKGVISYDLLVSRENSSGDVLGEVNDPYEQVVRTQLIEKMLCALKLLPSEDRELIHALFFCGISEHELARRTGITQSTINERKKRILVKLHKLIEN